MAISLFNYQRFLEACLDSVSAQSHPRLELIVVDDDSRLDDSTGAARAWMERHADRFEHSLLLKHVHNRGLAAARNTAFALARTDYVFVLDADNVVYSDAVARLFAMVTDEPYDAAYSQIEIFGDRQGLGTADVWSRRRLALGPYIDAMSLVRRRSWEQVGGYDHIEGGWEDYDFWCKFAEAGMTGLFVPEVLCRYRVHGSSMTLEHTSKLLSQIPIKMTARHPWLRLPR
ncbi:glycosyltransferase family 2 protein [Hyphomicrobiales bacterium BP6-180914]|uniref:Glycosyltransferase family 2 protein n=1 Tax=Lichenifustis flavocetrariae TaxID=2949735 RepID=A0AA41Z1U0_9HYPH|nr:glycosyltransferase family 2 protein [Lichenifustis flavocetrariae]